MNQETKQAPSELDQLEREAQAIDAELAGQEFSAEPEMTLNQAFKPAVIKFLSFGVALVDSRISFCSQHFNQAALENIADSLIKVADVEGVDLQALLGDPNSRLGIWLSLAVAAGLPAFTFYLAVQDYKKAHQKTEAPKETVVNDIPKPAHEEAQKTGFHG